MKRIASLLFMVLVIAGGCSEAYPVQKVVLETTQGDIEIEIHPDWAPVGSAHFLKLVKAGFYDGCAFFRVIKGFMAQTGINGDPKLHAQWKAVSLKDEPPLRSNSRGAVTFANSGPDSRATQFFINLVPNQGLDAKGFAPFGVVTAAGMVVADKLYSGYGEGGPQGKGPIQPRVVAEGNGYLKKDFPRLDYIKKAYIK